ncbi:MAG: hypothetical protein ACLT74_01080 [Christensenellales bacterium]
MFGVCAALCGFTPGTALANCVAADACAVCGAGVSAGAWQWYVPTEAIRGLWEAPAGTSFA